MSDRCTGSFEEVTPAKDHMVECSVCQKKFKAESYTHPVYGLSWMVPEHQKGPNDAAAYERGWNDHAESYWKENARLLYKVETDDKKLEEFKDWLLAQYRYCSSKAREIGDSSSEDCLCYLSEADAFYEAYHFLKTGERKYNCGEGSENE